MIKRFRNYLNTVMHFPSCVTSYPLSLTCKGFKLPSFRGKKLEAKFH